MPDYFDRYINLVSDVELSQAFDDSLRQLDRLDKSLLTNLDGKTYAPGKWTVKEHLQHLSDTERILSYRTLLFARRDETIPASFDQDFFVANSRANERAIDDLIGELKAVRASTKAMFDGFDDEELRNRGTNWKYEISVLAMGFAIVGHQIHHLKIIKEKYYPLAESAKVEEAL